jgi:hypothetical protein
MKNVSNLPLQGWNGSPSWELREEVSLSIFLITQAQDKAEERCENGATHGSSVRDVHYSYQAVGGGEFHELYAVCL